MDAIPVALTDRSAWRIQTSVIWALYLRETKVRFGPYKLGLLWAIIESLMSVGIKAVVFGLFLQITIPSMPYAIFLLSGFLPFRIFTGFIQHGIGAIASNEGLLVYRQLKPIDPLLARMMLEILIFFISIGIFFAAAIWFGTIPDFHKPLEILFALLSLFMLSAGLSIFLGMLAHKHRELEKIIPVITQPFLFVSCVLYPLSSVPVTYQEYFMWNPLVVILETIRSGLYQEYPSVELPILYPFAVGLASLAFGLSYYWRNRDRHYMGSSR